MRWGIAQSEAARFPGDHWERSYGDLEWRGMIPNRVMPWYFLAFDGKTVQGHGVKTQPAAFCFWQSDKDGFTLTIDLRNGGEATLPGKRELLACTVVAWRGQPGDSVTRAAHEFCTKLCPSPRLPTGSLFGSNDWNDAYGKNTEAGILRDADLIASIAASGNMRPYIVIDDAYQDLSRFPDMANLASEMRSRKLRPGIWVRPLQARLGAYKAIWGKRIDPSHRTASDLFAHRSGYRCHNQIRRMERNVSVDGRRREQRDFPVLRARTGSRYARNKTCHEGRPLDRVSERSGLPGESARRYDTEPMGVRTTETPNAKL